MKKQYILRVCSILLLITIISAVMISCGNPSSDGDGKTTTSANSGENVQEETTETTQMEADIPEDTNYDGYTFTFLISGNAESGEIPNDIHSDEENGEPINDARYLRNYTIEEKLNIKIEDVVANAGTNGDGLTKFRTSVLSGDNSYDAAMMGGYDACALANEGYLYNMNSISYIDLTKPWWDQKANEDLMINNKMYYTTGSISTAINDATYGILFNKKLVEDYDLPNYYEMVDNGTWTIDAFCESVVQVHSDMNGDGVFDTNDLYGALLWDDTMMGVVNATGIKCATVNDSGQIELTINDAKVITMIEKYFSVAFDKEVCHTYQRANWDGIAAINMFNGNQALFFLQLLKMVGEMRNMDADFGVLPYFKYDEAQEEYYHTVGSWHSMFLCVPYVQEDVDRTGAILESMAAKSMYTVTPAYYEISLQHKYTRDEESSAMLDLIFATRTFDLGWYYAIGGYNEQVMNLLRNFNSDISSTIARFEKTANKLIEKLNTAFSEIE